MCSAVMVAAAVQRASDWVEWGVIAHSIKILGVMLVAGINGMLCTRSRSGRLEVVRRSERDCW